MPLSVRDRKILWARSGNLCAFPGCSQQLVEPGSDYGSGIVVGEEAHILAHKAAGPRGAVAEGAVDTCDNLILLCPTHHRIVDEQPDVYTAEMLHAFKQTHEMRVRADLLAASQVQVPEAAGYESVCGGLRAVNAWRIGQSVIVVCSFGSDPVSGPAGRWRGAGLAFHQIHASAGSQMIFTSSEADPDIEYWVVGDILHVIQQTYDPDAEDIVPLVEHRFDCRQLPARHSLDLLLCPDADETRAVPTIARTLAALPREADSADAERLLYKLRNAGVYDPDAALLALEGLKSSWWYDGANAEAATAIANELKLAKAAT